MKLKKKTFFFFKDGNETIYLYADKTNPAEGEKK